MSENACSVNAVSRRWYKTAWEELPWHGMVKDALLGFYDSAPNQRFCNRSHEALCSYDRCTRDRHHLVRSRRPVFRFIIAYVILSPCFMSPEDHPNPTDPCLRG